MTIKRAAIRALDRAGSRWFLGALTTWYARRATNCDVAVVYDDLWIRSLDSAIYIADSPKFEYYAADLLTFPETIKRLPEEVRDFWFQVYKPQAGDVIIDVGAGIGLDAFVFSQSVGESGKVIAIEAHPTTFLCLEKLCELNQLTNTTRLQFAVVDGSREVYIEDSPNNLVNTTASTASNTHVHKVPGFSLDEICEQLKIERIDFLKMNIEGAERLAIQGMSRMIGKTRYVCIACHDFLCAGDMSDPEIFSTRETVVDFLRRNHFQVVMRPDDPRPYVRDHVHAVREDLRTD